MSTRLQFSVLAFFFTLLRHPRPTLFPYTTLFRSAARRAQDRDRAVEQEQRDDRRQDSLEHGLNYDLAPRCADEVGARRSEEHTSELQSLRHLVCRLLLEKKNKNKTEKLSQHKHRN